ANDALKTLRANLCFSRYRANLLIKSGGLITNAPLGCTNKRRPSDFFPGVPLTLATDLSSTAFLTATDALLSRPNIFIFLLFVFLFILVLKLYHYKARFIPLYYLPVVVKLRVET